MDHLAHKEGLDGRAFHLTDPNPKSAGHVINVFARAAHAPEFAMRIGRPVLDVVPKQIRKMVTQLPPVRRITDQVLSDFGIPRQTLSYIDYPSDYDSRDAQAELEGSGISVPALEAYADKLWDHWERNLDPDLFKDRSLRGAIEGKVVVITGASSEIGHAVALKVGEAGGITVLVARSAGQAGGDEGGDRGVGWHRHRAQRPTCRSSTTATVWWRRSSPSTAVWTSSSTTPADRSVARSSTHRPLPRLPAHDAAQLLRRAQADHRFSARGMRERKSGHIINVSSIGAQTNTPRFSAYVASKSALDAFSRCIASELVDDHVNVTTIYMPLVRTPMIAPTGMYDAFPTASPDEAADLVTGAMISKQKKVATRLGTAVGSALRAGAKVGGRDPQHCLQAVPRQCGRTRQEGGEGGARLE